MSFSVNGTSITLTRGDTFETPIEIKKNGEDYTPAANDKVLFSLKRDLMTADKSEYIDEKPLISKVIPNDTMMLILDPEDTENLPFGKYVYDIKIIFESGKVNTFIENAKFRLSPNVGGRYGSDQGESDGNSGD